MYRRLGERGIVQSLVDVHAIAGLAMDIRTVLAQCRYMHVYVHVNQVGAKRFAVSDFGGDLVTDLPLRKL